MPYIGQPLNAGNLSVQTGTGDGSDTTPIAALNYSVGSSESVAIYLDGVKQAVSTYTASGTTLTFTTAPPNGVGIEVVFLALSISLPTPGDGSVTAAKIAANAVDETKLKDALVADFTEVVVSASDSLLIGDATDSGNTKRDTVQGILDLVPAGGGQIKVVTTTYDVSTATGTLAITGAGFTPTAVSITGAIATAAGGAMVGWGSTSSDNRCIFNDHQQTANTWNTVANIAMFRPASGNWTLAVINSLDADGCTLGWTKSSSPTGTATLIVTFFG